MAAAEALADGASTSPTATTSEGLLRLHATLADTAARQESLVRRFTAGHPGIPLVEVPAAAEDIHDLAGLRSVGAALAGG